MNILRFFISFVFVLSLFVSPANTLAEPKTTTTKINTTHSSPMEDETPTLPELKRHNLLTESKPQTENSQDQNTIEAESYILLDMITGKVMTGKNVNQPRPPASMTKMMTAFVVLDEIKRGKLHWDDIVTVSERAAKIDEAQIYLVPGEKITVKELFTGVMVQSGNDAAVALAEHVAGSEEKFVEMMNQKAKLLKLKNTHFLNCTGLNQEDYPDPPQTTGKHEMSAYDTAKLGKMLIVVHPNIFKFTTITTYTFHPGTSREQKVTNWNKMLPGLKHEYKGVDGIKTGSTIAAGYCFTGTIKKGNKRYISVVMGTKSADERFTETADMYNMKLKDSK